MSSKNILAEIQDPKVLNRLRDSFFALIIASIFVGIVAFAVSEDFRNLVTFQEGVGDNQPVQIVRTPALDQPQRESQATKENTEVRRSSQGRQDSSSPSRGEGVSIPQLNDPPKSTDGGGSDNPSGNGDPVIQSPTQSPVTAGSPSTPGQQPVASPGGPTIPSPTPIKPQVPPVTVPSTPVTPPVTIPTPDLRDPVGSTVDTVNDTVNEVTGIVNDVTQGLPVETNIPKVCVLKPC